MKKCIIVIVALIYIFLSASMLYAIPFSPWTQKSDFGG